jgi:hypothetical protein
MPWTTSVHGSDDSPTPMHAPNSAGPATAPPPSWGDALRLLPLFGIFALAGIAGAKGDLDGDGWRYLANARNLLHGGYASPETLMFWNGPGYPLTLVPWVALHAPMAFARLANGLWLYLAAVHCQGALRALGLERRSLLYAYLIAAVLFLHGALLGSLMSESLSAFLVCGAAWHYARSGYAPRAHVHLGLAGIYLGYLALTKVFFGYALEASLLVALGAWLGYGRGYGRAAGAQARAAASSARRGAVACALGLAVCGPWLAYTWSQTGKLHFWGNSGGLQAWYFSWPEKEYYGDWLNWQAILEHPDFFLPHLDEVHTMLKYDAVTQDSLLKTWARRNCREHPGKCFTNWRANVNRMVFGYPITPYAGGGMELATGNRSFIYALPFFLLAAVGIPGWLGRRRLRPEAHACLSFALLSLAGTSLLSAIPRQVFPLLPLVLIWCALAGERAFRLAIVPGPEGNLEVKP